MYKVFEIKKKRPQVNEEKKKEKRKEYILKLIG